VRTVTAAAADAAAAIATAAAAVVALLLLSDATVWRCDGGVCVAVCGVCQGVCQQKKEKETNFGKKIGRGEKKFKKTNVRDCEGARAPEIMRTERERESRLPATRVGEKPHAMHRERPVFSRPRILYLTHYYLQRALTLLR